MNIQRLVGIVLGMGVGAGIGYFLSTRQLFRFDLELFVLGGAAVGALFGLMVKASPKSNAAEKPLDKDDKTGD